MVKEVLRLFAGLPSPTADPSCSGTPQCSKLCEMETFDGYLKVVLKFQPYILNGLGLKLVIGKSSGK